MKKLFLLLTCSMAFLACENKNDSQNSAEQNSASGIYMLVSELSPMFNCNQQDTKTYLEAKGFTGRTIKSFSGMLNILEEFEGTEQNPLYEYTNENTFDVVLLYFNNDSVRAILYYASKGYQPNQVGKWLTHPGSTIQMPNWDKTISFKYAEIYHNYFEGEEDDEYFESLSDLSNSMSSVGDGDVVNVCWADDSDPVTHCSFVLDMHYAYIKNTDFGMIQMMAVQAKQVEPEPLKSVIP